MALFAGTVASAHMRPFIHRESDMIETYTAGALLTCAIIYSSNRATEMPWLYLAASSVLWPLWWAGFGIDTY